MTPQKFKQTEIGMIPEDWEVKELGEISKFKYGLGESAQEKGAFVYIRITDINQDGTLIKNNFVFMDNKKVKEDCILEKGDVLVARTGATFGKTYYFNEDFKATFGGFLIKFILDKKVVDSNFFFQFSRGKNYWDQAKNLVSGGAQPQFNANVVSKLKIPLPPLPEQLSIAQILSSLDAKIEINNKMNKTLEAIGQAIFKKWFVEGRKGEWKEGKLGEIGKIQPGFAFKSSDFVNKGYKLIKIRNIQNPVVDIIKVDDFLSKEIFNKIDKKIYLGSGDILIAMTGAELGKVGIIPRTKDRMLLNQRVGKVISENPFLFYFYITSPEMQGYFKGIASASSAQGNISNSDIEGIDILVPDKDIINKFTSSTKNMFELWISNLQQNQTLSSIRDALLPKLMSGEIRVR